MKNHKKCQYHTCRKGITPVMQEKHFTAAIRIPVKENTVTISIEEYAGLIANNALLNAVKNYTVHDQYHHYTDICNFLAMTSEKEEKS